MLTKVPEAPAAAIRRATRRVPPHRRLPLTVFGACLFVELLWWAAFYPGMMSYDSVTYVWHVTSGHWSVDHSVLYDALVRLSLTLTGDLALLTLGQAVAAAALLAWSAVVFRDFGVPGRWTAVAALAVTVLPATGSFVVTVWKDVPFALCSLALTLLLARFAQNHRSRGLLVAFAAGMFGLAAFRNNGFLVAAIALVVAVPLLRGMRRRLLVAGAAPILVALLLTWLVFPALGVAPARAGLTYATAYGDIAVAYQRRPSAFTRADLAVMRRYGPLARWRSAATCYDVDPTMNGLDWARLDQGHAALDRVWLRTLERAPDLVLGARLCRGSIAWVAFPGNSAETALSAQNRVTRDLFGWTQRREIGQLAAYRGILRTRPLSTTLHRAAAFARTATQTEQAQWLLWRGATWCYLAYAAVFAFAWVRRRRRYLAVAALVAGQQVGVLVAVPAQLFRYMAGPIMIGIVLLPLLAAAVAQRRGREV